MNHSFNATHFTFYERKNWCSVWLATILVSTDLSSCSIVFTFMSMVSILQVHCVPHFCFVIDTDTSSISCLSQITVLYYALRLPSWFPTVADNRWPFFFSAGSHSGLYHSPEAPDGLVHRGEGHCQTEGDQGACDETERNSGERQILTPTQGIDPVRVHWSMQGIIESLWW